MIRMLRSYKEPITLAKIKACTNNEGNEHANSLAK
jgi:hypothetical protein